MQGSCGGQLWKEALEKAVEGSCGGQLWREAVEGSCGDRLWRQAAKGSRAGSWSGVAGLAEMAGPAWLLLIDFCLKN